MIFPTDEPSAGTFPLTVERVPSRFVSFTRSAILLSLKPPAARKEPLTEAKTTTRSSASTPRPAVGVRSCGASEKGFSPFIGRKYSHPPTGGTRERSLVILSKKGLTDNIPSDRGKSQKPTPKRPHLRPLIGRIFTDEDVVFPGGEICGQPPAKKESHRR